MEGARVRTLATHDVVQRLFPRPVTERNERAMAAGKAIDEALSGFSYALAQGRRPTVGGTVRFAEEILERELADAGLDLDAGVASTFQQKVAASVRLFRASELGGLSRPRSRLILIGGDAGIYAQPDFWDGRGRIYELKSYRAFPPTPDVQLQLDLFQLAFPEFTERLVSLDRHADPVTLTLETIAPISAARKRELLATSRELALAHGVGKVLRYVDAPTVRYPADTGTAPIRPRSAPPPTPERPTS